MCLTVSCPADDGLQDVSGCCALLPLKQANNTYFWIFRKWGCYALCISSKLTMPVLGSSVCEWMSSLLYLSLWQCLFLALQPVSDCYAFAMFLACWQCLSLALQSVSGCYTLLHLKPLIMNFIASSVGEWLPCLTMFWSHWWCLSWVFSLWVVTIVCCTSATEGCLWPFSMWVLPCFTVFQACW